MFEFNHLLAILGPDFDEKTILKGLHEFAVLVQGCWVVKRFLERINFGLSTCLFKNYRNLLLL